MIGLALKRLLKTPPLPMVDKKDDTETLLEFPCQYTLKVIGRTSKDFEAEAVRIVREHFPNLGEGAISLKQSKEKINQRS